MAQLLTLLLIAIAVMAMWRFLRTTPLARLSPATQSWLWLAVVILVVLTLTGRLGLLIPLAGTIIAAAVAILSRVLPLLAPLIVRHLPHGWWSSENPQTDDPLRAGASPRVQSRHLRMQLDPTTGAISGEIIEGPQAGNRLDQLSLEELTSLHAWYLRNDADSATLLKAYMEQRHESNWRTDHASNDMTRRTGMSRDEALEILGLNPGADREQIVEAHRRLIQRLHPDRGGSDYLAAKINQARNLLLSI